MKHIRCGGELSPQGTYRLKNGSLRYLYTCDKCKKLLAYREDKVKGAIALRCDGERTKKVCEECGQEFWARPKEIVCGLSCAGRRRSKMWKKLREDKERQTDEASEKKSKPKTAPEPKHKASLKDYSADCREYRARTGQYLSYRDYQMGRY